MDLNNIFQTLNSENGLAKMMQEPAFEGETGNEFSQADLIADVVNILRMDTKRVAEAAGVDVEIKRMTPGRAAELLQGVAKGDDLGLIDIFDEIEDQRMQILAEIDSEEAVEEYQMNKQSLLYTVPGDVAAEPEVENAN